MDDFLLFLLVGALAQLVDGAIGMAYGVISSSVLLATGIPPAQASACIHAAELFTTAASGGAHMAHRNIDWQLFWKLTLFGVAGGVAGTYVLVGLDGSVLKPYVAGYLGIIGSYLVVRSFRKIPQTPVRSSIVPPLATAGGFLDSIGGGGWGPIVSSGLLGAGGQPRFVVGSVNAAEFFVALAVSLTFVAAIVTGRWESVGVSDNLFAIGGLVLGGVFTAPIAAYAVKFVPEKLLLFIVGILICSLSIFQFVNLAG